MDSNVLFKCVECEKIFKQKFYLEHHIEVEHSGVRYRCPQCVSTFTQKKSLARHFKLKHCDAEMLSSNHIKDCLKVKPVNNQEDELPPMEPDTKCVSKDDDDQPADLCEYPDDAREQVKDYWCLIKTRKSISNLLDHVYNYRWAKVDGDFKTMLADIYHTEKECFRLNAAIGSLLKNRETGELKYWYTCHNNFTLLDKPALIKNGEDVKQLIENMKGIDLQDKFARPDTRWGLYIITNIEFYVIPQKDFVAGCRDFLLPENIAHQRHNLIGMTQDRQHHKFTDNLCLFRCLAHCLTGDFEDKAFVFGLFMKYCQKKKIEALIDTFYGVPYTDLALIEKLFSVDIQVFHLDQLTNSAVCWKNVIQKYSRLLNLDLSLNECGQAHYSYIVNLDQYAKRYSCQACGRMFKKREKLNKHSKNHCHLGKTVHKFPGGIYSVKKSLFEQLEELEISINGVRKFCPYFAVYDFEALLIKKSQQSSGKLIFIAQHQPVSCAIATSLPGFESVCFVEKEPDILAQKMISHLELISFRQNEILTKQYEHLFSQLESLSESCKTYIQEQESKKKDCRREKGHLSEILAVKRRLERYCSQLTCLGFNSGKYDINLIKRNIFPKLVQQVREDEEKQWPKAILRNGAFLCLSTDKLKFLDISLYVAPGFSLDSFMRAYGASLSKAKFPYEYLDSFDKLNDPKLPASEAFYSTLRKEPISAEEYMQCQRYWTDNNMTTLKDFLVFYNLRDVVPFLEAVSTMADLYWVQFGIDIFREAMSLPGVTERYLFKSIPDTHFSLFSEKTKDIYYTLKSSMRGGLAMVMTRLAIKDKTFVRNNPEKPVKAIIGLDFNALYLWAQSMPTPTGFFDHWVLDGNRFRKVSSAKKISIEWLEQESWKSGHFIQRIGNGKEKCIGARYLPVDGYCRDTNCIYEFYGCYWHCHNCYFSKVNQKKDSNQEHQNRLEKEAYVRSLGYNLVTIWECQWSEQRQEYIKERSRVCPQFFRQYQFQKFVDKTIMEKSILDGKVFGFAKVNIYTPDRLKEAYADFPPIIKHAEVGRNDAGDLMKEYAERTEQLKQPRKNLISSYFGKEIMLSTPMIQFLVNHGMILEKIYEIIQFDKSTPFEQFKDKVTSHRREGDANPELSMIADTFKLLGNTGYGKTLTNKERHLNVFYTDYKRAAELSRSPYINKIKCITENCYEVHMHKQEITMDLPIVVGLSVYNWAKIRMLEFFYDILQKYFNPACYQCMETDTDSIYLAISTDNLLDIVRPELQDQFMTKVYPKWFVTKPDDKRTPGLLKVEWAGTSMCCLSAKTYMGVGEGSQKLSCKGIMKKTNDLSFDKYVSVLETKEPWNGVNIGFRMLGDNRMWTYIQQKQGLPFLYIKRKVLGDGITTVPLDL